MEGFAPLSFAEKWDNVGLLGKLLKYFYSIGLFS